MVDGIAERLVDVAGDARVKADHLADGHEISFVIASGAKQSTENCFAVENPIVGLMPEAYRICSQSRRYRPAEED